eukprot:CAMPEP_0182607576 /NCGR_PEP_ID=MMETSP1330-20130603/2239_1 /TAXON_ID=464278 /ORGANISM="Picochlorum sp., Strain RCC944" /LENGTH=111 /DNA_ID=CAMNT_0024826211 /DNA_START=23 /DNA_END=359 /DNA_ORIENTATION=-
MSSQQGLHLIHNVAHAAPLKARLPLLAHRETGRDARQTLLVLANQDRKVGFTFFRSVYDAVSRSRRCADPALTGDRVKRTSWRVADVLRAAASAFAAFAAFAAMAVFDRVR